MDSMCNTVIYAASAAVLESIGTFKVLICRHGKLTNTVKVRYGTETGFDSEGLYATRWHRSEESKGRRIVERSSMTSPSSPPAPPRHF